MRRLGARAFLLMLAALAAGCSSGKGASKLTCPVTLVAPTLGALAELPPDGSEAPEKIHFTARIAAASSTCVRDDHDITVDTHILLEVARSDKEVRKRSVTYFVALADGRQQILAKQTFTLDAEFAPRQNRIEFADNTSEHLPVKDFAAGKTFAVIVGLQLTPEQLEFNRKHLTP